MAFTLEQIGEYLKELEFNFEHDTERDAIVTGAGKDGQSAMIFIRAKEDGEMFSLQMEPLNDDKSGPFDIPMDHEHIQLLLPQLLYANFQSKFGTWEYDPSDGDIRFAIEIPLEDAKMTENQFKRIMSMVFTALDEQKKFKTIINTGEVPEDDADEDQLEMLKKLVAMMEAEKKDRSGGDEDGI